MPIFTDVTEMVAAMAAKTDAKWIPSDNPPNFRLTDTVSGEDFLISLRDATQFKRGEDPQFRKFGDMILDMVAKLQGKEKPTLSRDVAERFVTAWNEMAAHLHATAQAKGWWDRILHVPSNSCNEGKGHDYTYFKGDRLSAYDERHDIRLICKHCQNELVGDELADTLWAAATERNKGEILALLHSEISEVLEGLRKGDPANDQLPQYRYSEVELADLLIRLADASQAFGWRVGEATVDKAYFNEGRAYRHGKQF
jgi:hypothetical protein